MDLFKRIKDYLTKTMTPSIKPYWHMKENDFAKGCLIRFVKSTEVYETSGGPMYWGAGDIEEADVVFNQNKEVKSAEIGWGCGQEASVFETDAFVILTPEEWGCKNCKWENDEFIWKCDSCFSKEG